MDSSCFVSLSLFLRTPSPQQEGVQMNAIKETISKPKNITTNVELFVGVEIFCICIISHNIINSTNGRVVKEVTPMKWFSVINQNFMGDQNLFLTKIWIFSSLNHGL